MISVGNSFLHVSMYASAYLHKVYAQAHNNNNFLAVGRLLKKYYFTNLSPFAPCRLKRRRKKGESFQFNHHQHHQWEPPSIQFGFKWATFPSSFLLSSFSIHFSLLFVSLFSASSSIFPFSQCFLFITIHINVTVFVPLIIHFFYLFF